MRLSVLAQKECIEVANGVRYGYLSESECYFDTESGQIHGFELAKPKSLFAKKQEAIFIPWAEIVLIGSDRVLFQKAHLTKVEP